jgi:hypothetical protein
MVDKEAELAGKRNLRTSTPWHVDAAREEVSGAWAPNGRHDLKEIEIDLSRRYVARHGDVDVLYSHAAASWSEWHTRSVTAQRGFGTFTLHAPVRKALRRTSENHPRIPPCRALLRGGSSEQGESLHQTINEEKAATAGHSKYHKMKNKGNEESRENERQRDGAIQKSRPTFFFFPDMCDGACQGVCGGRCKHEFTSHAHHR